MCILDIRSGRGATALPEGRGGATEVVYKPEGGRPILDVELHWNADRLLFSGVAASNAWHVMELDLATRKVRQVTRDNAPDINHYDPCCCRLAVRSGGQDCRFRRAYRPYAPVYDVGFRIAVEK